MKVVMLSKRDNIFCDYAEKLLESYFETKDFLSIRGTGAESFDDVMDNRTSDYLISFLSPWIVPASMIQATKVAAINFHPGSPDYPGTGCYNFALYENAKKYGVTCHYMNEKVDTGKIIRTSYFPVAKRETVETLKLKSMTHLLYLLEDILNHISMDDLDGLKPNGEVWTRKPFTRKQMLDLFEIHPQIDSQEEISRKIRAAQYPGMQGAYIQVGEDLFFYEVEQRKPIV